MRWILRKEFAHYTPTIDPGRPIGVFGEENKYRILKTWES